MIKIELIKILSHTEHAINQSRSSKEKQTRFQVCLSGCHTIGFWNLGYSLLSLPYFMHVFSKILTEIQNSIKRISFLIKNERAY